MGGSFPTLVSWCSSCCGWDRFCTSASAPRPVSNLDILYLLVPLLWLLLLHLCGAGLNSSVPWSSAPTPPLCWADAGGVRLINATVVCVNVLLLGPTTADMLVREGLCWGGSCTDPRSCWAHRWDEMARILQVLPQVWLTGLDGREGAYVCRIVFRHVL